MYDQPLPDDILFYMLYGGVAVLTFVASCYLLFRRGNAFAPDITTPIRLRRWTAASFAAMTLSHLWYLPTAFAAAGDEAKLYIYVGAILDFLLVIPLAGIILLVMLQDRRRRLWPIVAFMVPLAAGALWCLISGSDELVPPLYIYMTVVSVIYIIYVVRAQRQYSHWLRDNYADLEHKEVWQCYVVIAFILFVFGYYVFANQAKPYEYVVQISVAILVCFLLWRVETLSDLSISQPLSADEEAVPDEEEMMEDDELSQNAIETIGPLLQEFCIDKQLYLQHDLALSQLAKTIGTNRYYLSQYFSCQGMTYNTYINDLRVNHFVNLYREAIATGHFTTAQQLAYDSGYKSYSTFSLAFKQRMGQTVTSWMREFEGNSE